MENRKPTIHDIEGKTYEDDSDDMEGDSDICNVPDSQSGPEQSQELGTEQVQDSNIETVQGDISNAESHQTEQARVEMPRKVISKFSIGETVTFSLNGENYTVKILNRAGKAGGKYKNTFNVEYKAPSDMKDRKGYVDFDQVEDINIGNNDNVAAEDLTKEVLHVESSRFHEAKLAELLSWKENHVYDEVEYRNQSTMSVRWILTFKDTESGIIRRARLVARGFEEENENIIKESPTVPKMLFVYLLQSQHKGYGN